MIYDVVSNIIGEAIVRNCPDIKGSMLDANNIVCKVIEGKWIGKRSVWTFDRSACWLEETTKENVKSWWCGGENANYDEVFYRQ